MHDQTQDEVKGGGRFYCTLETFPLLIPFCVFFSDREFKLNLMSLHFMSC